MNKKYKKKTSNNPCSLLSMTWTCSTFSPYQGKATGGALSGRQFSGGSGCWRRWSDSCTQTGQSRRPRHTGRVVHRAAFLEIQQVQLLVLLLPEMVLLRLLTQSKQLVQAAKCLILGKPVLIRKALIYPGSSLWASLPNGSQNKMAQFFLKKKKKAMSCIIDAE